MFPFRVSAFLLLVLLVPPALGEDGEPPPSVPAASPATPHGLFPVVGAELVRYGADSLALIEAPASWKARDWERLGAFGAALGGLFLADREIYRTAQDHRTPSSDRFFRAVEPFGAEYAIGLSASLLVGGLAFGDRGLRETGRDAVEASILTGVLTNLVLKPAFGRERPYVSDGETVFVPFSSNASFPSGHATEAFAVASVIAMRTDGWIVPSIAYTTASLVGLARIHEGAHFASDVLAGAVLGTVVGRFVVGRHVGPGPDEAERPVRVSLVAIRNGLAVHISYR